MRWTPTATRGTTAAVVGALLLTGCSAAADGTDDGLVVGISADPTQLVPWTATALQSQQVLGQIYSTLLDTDADLQPVPGLADLPQVSADGLTYTFRLRDGVTFADGSALDSADVEHSLEAVLDPDTGAVSRSYLTSVTDVSAPDPLTVVLTLGSPDAALTGALTSLGTAVLSADDSLDELATTPNGSGPYQLASRRPNQQVVLERNDSYYRGRPGLPSVEFRVFADQNALVTAVRAGNVDLAIFDDSVTARSAESDDVRVETVDQLQYHALQLRAVSETFSDVERRLALQCAIDRSEVVQTAALGEGEVVGPITSPAFLSDPQARPCPDRDPDAAREHLAAAGVPEGFSFTAIVPLGLYASATNEAQNIQAQLADVGIDMEVEALDSGAYVDRWLAGDFDAAIALNGASADPDSTYGRYFTSAGSFQEVSGYSSPSLDALFAEGRASSDDAVRQDVYRRISAELEDQAAWIWLYSGRLHIALADDVTGFEARTDAPLTTLWQTEKG